MKNRSNEPFVGEGFIYALIGITILILLGGGTHVVAQGFALLLAGWFLLKFPPRGSLGPWVNTSTLIFILGGAMSFLPGGLGFLPDWRVTGMEVLGMDFSGFSSVRPLQSAEAFLMVVASLAWFYVMSQLSLNMNGRRWIFFGITSLGLIFAVLVILGMRCGFEYPGSAMTGSFTFFAAQGQMGLLLLLFGIFSFCYGMESLTHRSPLHLIGIPASAACFIALIYGNYTIELLFFFIGMGFYSAPRIWVLGAKLWQKLATGLVFYGILFVALTADGGLVELTSKAELPVKTWQMFVDMPLTGIGLANYLSLAPHYFEVWQAKTEIAYPNDFMWVASGMGIFGVLGFAGILYGVFRQLDFLKMCRLGSFRLIAFLASLIYLCIGFSGESRHALALVYFVLLILVLAFPLERPKNKGLPLMLWKGCGGLFLAVGCLWIFGSITGLPVHSELALENSKQKFGKAQAETNLSDSINALDRLVKIDPMNWYWYHERAKLLLEIRERNQAEDDFKRALLVAPNLTSPAFEEGKAWFEHFDSRAEAAWAEALRRAGQEAPELFERMLQFGKTDLYKVPILLRLSRLDPEYAVTYLEQAEKARFLEELNRYLEGDPALEQFSRSQRTRIVLRWVWLAEFKGPKRYLDQYASSLNLAWYIQAFAFQNEVRIGEALELLRAGVTAPSLPLAEVDPGKIALLEREVASRPRNYKVGLQLLSVRLEQENLIEALQLVNKLLEYSDAPEELFYWQSELYYQRGNLVDSWLSMETYARRVLNLQRK